MLSQSLFTCCYHSPECFPFFPFTCLTPILLSVLILLSVPQRNLLKSHYVICVHGNFCRAAAYTHAGCSSKQGFPAEMIVDEICAPLTKPWTGRRAVSIWKKGCLFLIHQWHSHLLSYDYSGLFPSMGTPFKKQHTDTIWVSSSPDPVLPLHSTYYSCHFTTICVIIWLMFVSPTRQ